MQSFVVSKPFKVIFTDFFLLKNKIEKFSFLKGKPYFFKKEKNICLPGDEHAMVLQYVMEIPEQSAQTGCIVTKIPWSIRGLRK